MTEDQWVARARAEMRPPMPWFGLREMTDTDLRRSIASCAAWEPGQPAPAYLPPGEKPPGTVYRVRAAEPAAEVAALSEPGGQGPGGIRGVAPARVDVRAGSGRGRSS